MARGKEFICRTLGVRDQIKEREKTTQDEKGSHTFRTVKDTQLWQGHDVREGSVVQESPGWNSRTVRIVGYNGQWTLIDGIGIYR